MKIDSPSNLFEKALPLLFLVISFIPAWAFQKSDTVTISLGWYPQFQFAGYYAALHKGFYEEAGIKVNIRTHDEDGSAIDAVLSGIGQYGLGTGSMILGNKDVDKLVVLAAYQQQSPVVLICLDNDRFEKLKDFEESYVHGGTEIRAMFMSAGVKPDSIGLPYDIPEIMRLQKGEYDAMTMYITDMPMLKFLSDARFKIFKPSDYGINFYGESFFTSVEEVEENPERVEAILDATTKGWKYALENKEELADLLVEKYGSKFNRAQLLEEATIVEESLMIPSLYEIGSMQINRWAEMAKVLSTLNIIDNSINLDSLIYQRKESGWVPFVKTSLIVLILITAFLVVSAVALIVFNLRLRKEVNKRTEELKTALERLNLSLENEKHITDNLEKIVKERTRIIEDQKVKLEEVNLELEKRVHDRTRNLERTNKELDMFIYGMSHDIRAPLASVQGLINIIEIHPENKDDYIKLISQNIKQLDFFIEEILEYTRNTKRSLNSEIIELESLINSIFEQLKYISGYERVIPRVTVEKGLTLVSDKTRLMVVLRNLISNAIKYQDYDKESCFVNVTASTFDEKVKIMVEDNGMGISNEHLNKIYEMFYRATESSKDNGLGLYIVKEILDNMNAKISVESTIREGTTFTLELVNQPVAEPIE